MARRSKLTVSVRDDKGKVTRRRSLDEDVDAAEEVHEASVVVEKRKARSVPAGGNAVTRTPVKAASSSRRMSPRRR